LYEFFNVFHPSLLFRALSFAFAKPALAVLAFSDAPRLNLSINDSDIYIFDRKYIYLNNYRFLLRERRLERLPRLERLRRLLRLDFLRLFVLRLRFPPVCLFLRDFLFFLSLRLPPLSLPTRVSKVELAFFNKFIASLAVAVFSII
jgi:hypothetical protein